MSITKKRIEQRADLAGLRLKLTTEGDKVIWVIHNETWDEEYETNKEIWAFLNGYLRRGQNKC